MAVTTNGENQEFLNEKAKLMSIERKKLVVSDGVDNNSVPSNS